MNEIKYEKHTKDSMVGYLKSLEIMLYQGWEREQGQQTNGNPWVSYLNPKSNWMHYWTLEEDGSLLKAEFNPMQEIPIRKNGHMEWISVEDRMPELHDKGYALESDFVLCCHFPCKEDGIGPKMYVFYLCQYEDEDPEWVSVEDFTMANITHWMPLPELPKE